MSILAMAAVCSVTGCASTPNAGGSRRASTNEPLRGGVVEFQRTSFDGRVVEGRVLIGATQDPLVLDGRLAEWFAVSLTEVRECGKPELLDFWSVEAFLPPPRTEDIIHLRPGSWYGKNVEFRLLGKDEHVGANGVPCVEAVLVVRALDMRVVAKLPMKLERHSTTSDEGPGAPQ